jgi:hypothetical protein
MAIQWVPLIRMVLHHHLYHLYLHLHHLTHMVWMDIEEYLATITMVVIIVMVVIYQQVPLPIVVERHFDQVTGIVPTAIAIILHRVYNACVVKWHDRAGHKQLWQLCLNQAIGYVRVVIIILRNDHNAVSVDEHRIHNKRLNNRNIYNNQRSNRPLEDTLPIRLTIITLLAIKYY